jgi:hypothetical protein
MNLHYYQEPYIAPVTGKRHLLKLSTIVYYIDREIGSSIIREGRCKRLLDVM